MTTVSSRLSHAHPEFIFPLVGLFPPGLSLDVGAALGAVAKQVQQASPGGKVICFEPFEGNLPHFHETTNAMPGISLIKKAVADFDGPGVLFVPSVVVGKEKGWATRIGYSSAGMLIPEAEVAGKPGEKIFSVDVCSIDALVKEPVRFLKIDVQGGEAAVLRGAKNLIDNNLIDMMLVEFQGEEDVVDFVNSHDFAAFDIEYNAIPVGVTPDQLGFMEGYRELPLSSGSSAIRGRLDAPPRDFDELARFMRAWRPAKGYIWTDMLFVRRGFVDQFHAALDSINVPR